MNSHGFVPSKLVPSMLVGWLVVAGATAFAGELPKTYFELMAAGVKDVAPGPELRNPTSLAFAAAVLYAKDHPDNPSFGDERLRDLALELGDIATEASEKDGSRYRQDYEWEIHFWLDTYRLLEKELGDERRARWRKQLERNMQWFADHTEARIDFPRYQGPYIRTSTNHFAIWASSLHLASRVLKNKEWEDLATRAMHRLATEEQTEDGYFGEFTDNGPTTGYNYLTMNAVALYWEHSRDTAALESLRRATDFHKYFTWPDGTPVETINGRNRHWGVSAWGHFGFTHWPDGRRYAEFLVDFFEPGKLRPRDLGRLTQSALYHHEGPTAAIPQDQSRYAYQMKRVAAGMRKAEPWTIGYSGLYDPPSTSQFTLDRQGNLSIWHERLGMIVSGANSKNQPELATFAMKFEEGIATVPRNNRLRMSEDRDRLGLSYPHMFAELEIPAPTPERVELRFTVVEQGTGRLRDGRLNLQLVLRPGEVLETAKKKIMLGEERIELGPEEIGGWISHRGWKLTVDPTARLVWPVYPFSPYRNAPETEIRHAVGALTVPLAVKPPPAGDTLGWQRQEIAFRLEVPATAEE